MLYFSFHLEIIKRKEDLFYNRSFTEDQGLTGKVGLIITE
jgi:hypothetical protein